MNTPIIGSKPQATDTRKASEPYYPICIETEMSPVGSARNRYANTGWSKRDEFAAQAPQEIPSWFDVRQPDDGARLTSAERDMQRYFLWRYTYADLMLAYGA